MNMIAIRFFMIISLLVSLQTSADMLVAMDHVMQIQTSTMPHCADMANMHGNDHSQDHKPSNNKHHCERCNTSCCLSFISITTTNTVPLISQPQLYQKISALLPFRFTSINDRPPIFS